MIALPVIDSLPHRLADDAKLVGTIRKTDLPAGVLSESVYIPFNLYGAPLLGVSKYFPANPRLNGDVAEILAIEAIDNGTNVTLPTPTPSDSLAPTGANGLSNYLFVAATATNQIICSIALTSMVRRLNNGQYCLTKLNSQLWEACYIQRVAGGANAVNGIWLNVFYRPKTQW